MAKKTVKQSIFKKFVNFLSHPAWNGVACFFTVLGTLGFGSLVIAFALILFNRIEYFFLWVLEPVFTPRLMIIGGSFVLMAFAITSIRQFLSSRNKFSFPRTGNKSTKAKLKYLPVPIPPGIGNSYLKDRYISPPSGDVDLGGVQFQLQKDSLIFDTNKHIRNFLPLDYGGKQVDFELPESVNKIKSVNFLINSGNSKLIYANHSIGKIRLIFKEAPPIDVELILGKNVREWCPGNSGDYIRETSNHETSMNVWSGISKDGSIAVIDCLKIPVYEVMKDCPLQKIIFTHRSIPQAPDTMGVHYSVFGISLEIQ